MNPIDLLPVDIPFSDPNPPNDYFFYENVVKKLLPNVILMESVGIPIDMNRVKEIEEITDNVLTEVLQKINKNDLIKEYLEASKQYIKENKKKDIKIKEKKTEDFYRPFDIKNTVHLTFVVNYYLKTLNQEKDSLDKWTFKDLKKYAYIKGDVFLKQLAAKDIKPIHKPILEAAMQELARDKARIWNTNHSAKRMAKIESEATNLTFNPGSPKQKSEFFQFLSIDSESVTKKGSPQWNRDELLKLKERLEKDLENAND